MLENTMRDTRTDWASSDDKADIQIINVIPVDARTMFSNHKGVHKKGIEKRQRKWLDQIGFIRPFLDDDEYVFLVTSGCSPMPILEQFLVGWIIVYLKRSLFVFTNKRVFHVPTTSGFQYRASIASFAYTDCQQILQKGSTMLVKYRNGRKERFHYIAENRKVKAVFKDVVMPKAEASVGKRTHLCPWCRGGLVAMQYTCPSCGLEFKNRSKGRLLSVLLPGGGYWYTGHYFLGFVDAIAESYLTIVVILYGFMMLRAEEGAGFVLAMFGAVLAMEKGVTIIETNHFVDEYIPLKKSLNARPDVVQSALAPAADTAAIL